VLSFLRCVLAASYWNGEALFVWQLGFLRQVALGAGLVSDIEKLPARL
jgi:hypothetical protein